MKMKDLKVLEGRLGASHSATPVLVHFKPFGKTMALSVQNWSELRNKISTKLNQVFSGPIVERGRHLRNSSTRIKPYSCYEVDIEYDKLFGGMQRSISGRLVRKPSQASIGDEESESYKELSQVPELNISELSNSNMPKESAKQLLLSPPSQKSLYSPQGGSAMARRETGAKRGSYLFWRSQHFDGVQASQQQIEMWHSLLWSTDSETAALIRSFKERLSKIKIFKELKKDEMENIHAMFTIEQIKQVAAMDLEYAVNFTDVSDMRDALNSHLTEREKRKLIQRAIDRASVLNKEALGKSIAIKLQPNMYCLEAETPLFGDTELDKEMLQCIILSQKHSSSSLGVTDLLQDIIKQFCKPLAEDSPLRIVKLVRILDLKESIKLLTALPNGAVSSKDFSSIPSIAYVVDFIGDALEIGIEKDKILEQLQDIERLVENEEKLVELQAALLECISDWKKNLVWNQSRDIARKKNQKDREKEFKGLQKRFKLQNQSQIEDKHRQRQQDNRNMSATQREALREKQTVDEKMSKQHSKLKHKIEEQARVVNIQSFGPFLQIIPRPGAEIRFVTIQSLKSFFDASGAPPAKFDHSDIFSVTQDRQKLLPSEQQYIMENSTSALFQTKQKRAALKKLTEPWNSYFNELKIERNEELTQARQDKMQEKGALVACWQYSEKTKGFYCSKSFETAAPLPFKLMNVSNREENLSKIYLYRSQSEEIFWFSQNAHGQLQMNVLENQNDYRPVTYKIEPKSKLHDYIIFGNSQQEREISSFYDPVPTLIKDEEKRICVFTYIDADSNRSAFYPTVYFYDFTSNRELAKASGASIFLHHILRSAFESKIRLYLYCQQQHLTTINSIKKLLSESSDQEQQSSTLNLTQERSIFLGSLNDKPQQNDKDVAAFCFDCEVNFNQLRTMKDKFDRGEICQELITVRDLEKAATKYFGAGTPEMKNKKKSANNLTNSIKPPTNDCSSFKQIKGDQKVHLLSNAVTQVYTMRKDISALFSVSLITSSADGNQSRVRVIEAKDKNDIRLEMDLTCDSDCQYLTPEKQAGPSHYLLSCSKVSNSAKLSLLSSNGYVDHQTSLQMSKDEHLKIERPMIGLHELFCPAINKTDGSLLWFTVTLEDKQDRKQKRFQISNQPRHWVEFPWMCHLQMQHSNQEIVLTNLADQEEQQKTFIFEEGSQIVANLGMNQSQAATRISFLSTNMTLDSLKIIFIQHKRSFEKSQESEGSWTAQSFALSSFSALQSKLSEVRVAFLVEQDCEDRHIRSESIQPAILIQTDESIFFAVSGKLTDLRNNHFEQEYSPESEMTKVDLFRGRGNHFYYVEKEISSENNSVHEITFSYDATKHEWNFQIKLIYTSQSGQIVALKSDKDHYKSFDSYWSHEGSLRFQDNHVRDNRLFVLDSSQNLVHLSQYHGSKKYVVTKKQNLEHCIGLNEELTQSKSQLPSICISNRCLTIRGKHFIYQTGYEAPVKLEKGWKSVKSQSVKSTNLQIHLLQNSHYQYRCILKEEPGSRQCCFLGNKSQRDVLLCGFIADDKLLVKLRTDQESQTYWTIVDSAGYIYTLPYTLKRMLNDERAHKWKQMVTQPVVNCQTQILLRSKRSIAVLKFDGVGDLVDASVISCEQQNYKLSSNTVLCNYKGEIYRCAIISNETGKDLKRQNSIRDGERCEEEHPLSIQYGDPYPNQIMGPIEQCDRCHEEITKLQMQKGFYRCSECEYSVCHTCIPVTFEQKIELLPKENAQEDQNTNSLRLSQQSTKQSKLTCIFLNPSESERSEGNYEKKTSFVLCGSHLCWRSPNSLKISLMKIDCLRWSKKATIDMSQMKVRSISLKGLIEPDLCRSQQVIGLNACSPLFALHGHPEKQISEQIITQRSNLLQVTILSHAIVYDLDMENPTAMSDLPAMHQLLDWQNYVESGFEIKKIKNYVSRSGLQYQLSRQIVSNSAGNFYYIAQQQKLETALAQMTEDQNRESTMSPLVGFYRSYCELDIIEFKRIEKLIKQRKLIKQLDITTVFSVIQGQSLFSYFSGNLRLYQTILKSLQAADFPLMELDYDAEEIEGSNLRRIVQILSQKSLIKNSFKATTIIQRSMKEVRARDLILRIANLCPNFSLFSVVATQSDMKQILRLPTPLICELFNTCYVESKNTRLIKTIDWPTNLHLMTFLHQSRLVSAEEVSLNLQNQQQKHRNLKDTIHNQVTVRMLKLNWLYAQNSKGKHKNFADLVRILNMSNNAIFETDFVKNLLNLFWGKWQRMLFRFYFVPYVIYQATLIQYLTLSLDYVSLKHVNQISNNDETLIDIFSYFILIQWVYQMYPEAVQICKSDLKAHLSNVWNIVDLIELTMTLFYTVTYLIDKQLLPLQVKVDIAAIISCTLFMRLFDWFRLFESTAFYIQLVGQTLKDITLFSILMLTSLWMFGLPLVMLNYTRQDRDAVITAFTELWWVDMNINQYLLALGEFNYDDFSGEPSTYECFIFFTLATFFTQITMLNMLIAIMSDTFSKVTEMREVHARRTKLEILGDYVDCYHYKMGRARQAPFMFVVKPDELDLDRDVDSWQGSLATMRNFTEKSFELFDAKIEKQIAALRVHVEEDCERDAILAKESRSRVQKMIQSITSQNSVKFEQLSAKINQMPDQIIDRIQAVGNIQLGSQLNSQDQQVPSKEELQEFAEQIEGKIAQNKTQMEAKIGKLSDKVDSSIISTSIMTNKVNQLTKKMDAILELHSNQRPQNDGHP